MKAITELAHWSFIATSVIIYFISQFLLGLIFVGDKWQVTSGANYRLKKTIEFGLPVILGMILGYLIGIPAPDAIEPSDIARSVYFGFAGAMAPAIHGPVEAAFPLAINKMLDVASNMISGSTSRTTPRQSSEHPPEDPKQEG